jgi:signal transduction histidine kinase
MRSKGIAVQIRAGRRRAAAWVSDLSLRQKLVVVILLTCAVALLVAGTILGAWERTSLRRALVRDLMAQAHIVAENCRAAVAFGDRTDAAAILQTLQALPAITGACLSRKEDPVFASYVRKGTDPAHSPRALERDGAFFRHADLAVQVPVVLDGQRLGTITLVADLESLSTRLRAGIVVILGVLAASLVAAYLISARLQGIISKPILQLAALARLVSERKEYTARAAVCGRDEVGTLVEAFNEMLEQIRQRDAALVGANEQLEARVQERTAELQGTNEKLTREILARRQTDRALGEANEQLAETVKNLRRSNKELQDFAYVAAHDLRAPLRGIATLADWIAVDYAEQLDEQGHQQLQLLKGRVARMTDLINGILQYAEIGRVTSPRGPVDIGVLVRETVARLTPPASVEVIVGETLPRIVGEKLRLGQVFHHLIDNAIKYLDKPEGRVEIRGTADQNFWTFAVSDNGPGIEEKYFAKVFQMFQTLAPRDQRESTGIGLPIVKKIVELWGGSVWIESQPGEGATFLFTVPQAEQGRERCAEALGGVNAN